MDHEAQRLRQFVEGCLEELINCHGDPEWLQEEFELAYWAFSGVDHDWFQEVRAWVEGIANVKAKKRAGESRKKVATVVVHAISKQPTIKKVDRDQTVSQMKRGWIVAKELKGLKLSQIEACQMVLKPNCDCDKACKKVNYYRDWKDIEQACQQRLEELKNNHE